MFCFLPLEILCPIYIYNNFRSDQPCSRGMGALGEWMNWGGWGNGGGWAHGGDGGTGGGGTRGDGCTGGAGTPGGMGALRRGWAHQGPGAPPTAISHAPREGWLCWGCTRPGPSQTRQVNVKVTTMKEVCPQSVAFCSF